MSDCPTDLEFKLQYIVNATREVNTEWHDLGLQLGLPEYILKQIGSNPDIEGHLRMMLSKWLDYDTKASWEKLASALNTMGKNSVAAKIRSKFMKAATTTTVTMVADTSDDDKTCQEMNETVLQKIKRQFASLQLEVRSALEACQVKLNDVHQFLVSFFQSECNIPEATDLTKLFNSITRAKLWRYDHYSPLRELAETFLPDDNPARKLVSKYKDQLSGFYVTTKIVDFINLSELDDSEDDSDDDNKQILTPKEPKKLYRELRVTLKLDRKIKFSDMTMSYINTLWKALIEEFNLPPLTAVIKKIVPGSLIITWLVPPQFSAAILASYAEALRFYQQHNIVEVKLDDNYLYHESWILAVGAIQLYHAKLRSSTDEVKENEANVNNAESRATDNNDHCDHGSVDFDDKDSDDSTEEQESDDDNTALIKACRRGYVKRVRELLEKGTKLNVDYTDKDGRSALWHASSSGKMECVKVLLKYGAQVDLRDYDGNTALIKACQNGHNETARVLLDHGANVHYQNRNDDHNTVLIKACEEGHAETARMLLDHGANVNQQNEYGQSALHYASDNGKAECVEVLLKYGAQVDLPDKYGDTALIKACYGEYSEIARILVLEHGANIDHQNDGRETALSLASYFEAQDIVAILLKAGAKTDLQEKKGQTALYWAASRGQTNTVQMLINHGAAVNLGRDKHGSTGLMEASESGHVDTVRTLLEAKADPNITNEDGETALFLAIKEDHTEVIKILVKYGAAVDIKNKEGLTALDIASLRQSGYQSVCEILGQNVKQETKTDLTERILKMLERTFLKEQVKKKEEQQKKEHHHQRKERDQLLTKKQSPWYHLWRRQGGQRQTAGITPASEK